MMMVDRLEILDKMIDMQLETMIYGRVRGIVNAEDYEQKERNSMP